MVIVSANTVIIKVDIAVVSFGKIFD